ncbi:MAG TPA: hypothetical protein ENI33_09185 [Thermoplasmatales archaeon]|nr:hypothetical protein [Thermoplasmatales archaeon]
MIFDDDKKRRKDAEEFEKIMREMEKIIEDAFRNAFNMQPFVKGFSLKINEEGEPEIEEFGIGDKKTDIFEDENKVYITLELPETDENKVKVKLRNDIIEIVAGEEIKEIKLPSKVKRKFKKSFNNGILDIELEKAH